MIIKKKCGIFSHCVCPVGLILDIIIVVKLL